MPYIAMIVSLFFVFNALGSIPVFVSVLSAFNDKQQRNIILRELLIALGILLLFNFFGDKVMSLLGISQPVLGVAGGTLLFLIAIGMIFPRAQDQSESIPNEPFIVPLAIPMVAGPGAISTVMVYAERLQNVWVSSGILVAAWLPTCILLLLSSQLKQFLGQKGLAACQKLGGMLISIIAIQMICSGLTAVLREALRIPLAS